MRIRIPDPINSALDALTRFRLTALAATVAAGVVAASLCPSPVVRSIGAAVGVAFFAAVFHVSRVERWRERARQAEYDLASAKHEIDQMRAGDPAAPTAQLLAIGETGELT